MSLDVDAALEGVTSEESGGPSQETASDDDGLDPAPNAKEYDPAKHPHVKMETRDQRERDAIKRQEHESTSNNHKHYRGDGHGRDPFDRMLPHRIQQAFERLRSRSRARDQQYKRQAPFRIQIVDTETGEKETAHYYHGKDIMQTICNMIVPIVKGRLKCRVQKRKDKGEWWSGRSYPHKCAHIEADQALFGLNRMAQSYRWPVMKTRLPELEMAKTAV